MVGFFEELSASEVELVQQLKAEVANVVQPNPELQMFCNDWTYVRYLRARGWNLQKAAKMLHTTLQWRLAERPHAITWDQVEREAATGKTYVSPYPDRGGRPVVMMIPRNQNTKDESLQVKFLTYVLEHASRLADAQRGDGKMTWLLDFEGYALRNAPTIKTSLAVLATLQNHYPERLGAAVCYHAPSLFSVTWRAVSPFIDPVTAKKVLFVDKGAGEASVMAERFNLEHVERCMAGQLEGSLFDIDRYRARMQAEDAEVASAVKLLAASGGAQSASVASSLSDASAVTTAAALVAGGGGGGAGGGAMMQA